MNTPVASTVIERLKAALGPRGWLDEPAAIAPHVTEWRERWVGETPLVARPASTGEVARVVEICADSGTAIVPQSGNTGLVGGSVPPAGGGAIVLSLTRMNRLRALDAADFSLIAEAGCRLADLQAAAAEHDRLFALSMASQGSACIGGAVSTNAGGTGVVKYGPMRQLVLGLEVVLPDGQIWDGLKTLRKDNAGYDLKQLFIGAEGTLGVITAVACALAPAPHATETALLGVPDVAAAIRLLATARQASGDLVAAFELIPRLGLDFVVRHLPGARDPLAARFPWYVLVELSSARADAGLRTGLESLLEGALAAGDVRGGVIAASEAQRAALWALRHGLSEAQKFEGGSIKHDIAVPPARMADFITRASRAVEQAIPGARIVAFGHLGDGNVHFNISQPEGAERKAFLARWEEINRLVHDIVADMGGSFSAEHGIGQLKLEDMARYKSPLELTLMRKIKQTLDPHNIMNPGRVIPPAPPPGAAS
jgi:D-lactate dehydrogenase (cytochrome)